MSLDITKIDAEGKIVENIPITIKAHGEIFYPMKRGTFLSLERIRDYYSDALYSIDELDDLRTDLINLKKIHSNNPEHLELLCALVKFIEEAQANNFRIEVIAD